MAMKYKTEGGAAQAGSLGSDFTNFLQQGLQTGSFGSAGATSQAGAANPMGSTQGIAGILNDLLAGGAGKIGGSMAQMISTKQSQNVDALRSRFGVGGGTAFGTPAAFAESQYRATEAPELTTAIGNLQQSALSPLLQMMMGITGIQTPQAQTVGVQNPWVQGLQLALQTIGTLNGSGGGAKSSGGSSPSATAMPDFASMLSMLPPVSTIPTAAPPPMMNLAPVPPPTNAPNPWNYTNPWMM